MSHQQVRESVDQAHGEDEWEGVGEYQEQIVEGDLTLRAVVVGLLVG